MCAPKTPVLGVEPRAEALVQRLGLLGPGRGDVRRAVALARVAVERELADARGPRGRAERLVHLAVDVLEDPQRARPCRRGGRRSASSSSWVTPSRTSSPAPIAATVSPSTRDRGTRHALDQGSHGAIRSRSRSSRRGLLGRDDVQVHAGAELQPGEVRQARAGCRSASRSGRRRAGAVRTHRFSGGRTPRTRAQAAQPVVQQRGAERAVVLEARAGAARGEQQLVRQARGVGRQQDGLVVDGDDPLAPTDLLLRRGPAAGCRPSCASRRRRSARARGRSAAGTKSSA